MICCNADPDQLYYNDTGTASTWDIMQLYIGLPTFILQQTWRKKIDFDRERAKAMRNNQLKKNFFKNVSVRCQVSTIMLPSIFKITAEPSLQNILLISLQLFNCCFSFLNRRYIMRKSITEAGGENVGSGSANANTQCPPGCRARSCLPLAWAWGNEAHRKAWMPVVNHPETHL